jgi:hypothetical protein
MCVPCGQRWLEQAARLLDVHPGDVELRLREHDAQVVSHCDRYRVCDAQASDRSGPALRREGGWLQNEVRRLIRRLLRFERASLAAAPGHRRQAA